MDSQGIIHPFIYLYIWFSCFWPPFIFIYTIIKYLFITIAVFCQAWNKNKQQQHNEPTCFKTAHFHITCIYSSHVTFHWLKNTQFINCLKIKTYLFCFLELEVLIHLIENVIYRYFKSCGWMDIHFSLSAAMAFHSLLFLAHSQRLLVFGCFFLDYCGPFTSEYKAPWGDCCCDLVL